VAGLQAAFTQVSGAAQARQLAHAGIYGILLQQSSVLAFVDTYRWMAVAVLACIPGALLMRKVIGRGGMAMH
jgi:hypothetical protein